MGGLELFVHNCFTNFKKDGVCKIAVAPDKKLDAYFEDNDKFLLKRDKFFPFIPALKLAKYIDAHNIDVLHFHWTRDIAFVVMASIFCKRDVKVVQSRHMTMTRFKDDFYHKWLYKHIDAIHAVTYQVKEQLQRFIPSDIRPDIEVVYPGIDEVKVDAKKVDALKSKYKKDGSFIVGIVGRIEEAKGQYIVIEALHKLKHLNIKLLIVGHSMDEAYLKELHKKVDALNLNDKVVFVGFSKDVDEYMSLCDCMVLATTKETFGLVVIEAMANKSSIIATNSGGPLEIIEDGVDGLFFDRSSDDLALKIEMLYKDEKLKNSLADAGYKKVKNSFDNKKQMQKLLEFLNK